MLSDADLEFVTGERRPAQAVAVRAPERQPIPLPPLDGISLTERGIVRLHHAVEKLFGKTSRPEPEPIDLPPPVMKAIAVALDAAVAPPPLPQPTSSAATAPVTPLEPGVASLRIARVMGAFVVGDASGPFALAHNEEALGKAVAAWATRLP